MLYRSSRHLGRSCVMLAIGHRLLPLSQLPNRVTRRSAKRRCEFEQVKSNEKLQSSSGDVNEMAQSSIGLRVRARGSSSRVANSKSFTSTSIFLLLSILHSHA